MMRGSQPCAQRRTRAQRDALLRTTAGLVVVMLVVSAVSGLPRRYGEHMAKNAKSRSNSRSAVKLDKASRIVSAKVPAAQRRSTVMRATGAVQTKKSVDFERVVRD